MSGRRLWWLKKVTSGHLVLQCGSPIEHIMQLSPEAETWPIWMWTCTNSTEWSFKIPIWPQCESCLTHGLVYRAMASTVNGMSNEYLRAHNSWKALSLSSALGHRERIGFRQSRVPQIHAARLWTKCRLKCLASSCFKESNSRRQCQWMGWEIQ